MILNDLSLIQYRNYSELALSFGKGLNILIGENAQGKTNLLESVYALAMTKSHRTSNEQELIQWGKSEASIRGTLERGAGKLPLEIIFSKKGRKTKVNHIEQKKLSDYIGQMNVVLFAPEDLSLVKGGPQLRRKFLDMELGQINPIYLHDLVQYQGVLKQRNRYLKLLAEKKQEDTVYLDVLTDQLAEFGSRVLAERFKYIERLELLADQFHQKISHQKETLGIEYVSSFGADKKLKAEEIQLAFLEKLKASRSRELFKQSTLAGPHRDDIIFLVNGKETQSFGSQGQQRTTVLSVKLAEINLMKEETGEYPILLLDDVMSELDEARQLQLLETIEGKVQTFLTTTTIDNLKNKISVKPEVFHVKQGSIEREELL